MCKDCGCECDCGGECECHHGRFERRYQTKAEQIADLEAYISELKLEVQAVEEHLADLKK
jgi:hypothetical protein